MESYFLKITRRHHDGRGNQRGRTKRQKLGPYDNKEKLKAAIMESIDEEESEINYSGKYESVSDYKDEIDNDKIEQILASGGGKLLEIQTAIDDEDYSTYNRWGREYKGDFSVTFCLVIESPTKKRKIGDTKSVFILSTGFVPDSNDKASTSDAEEEVFSDFEDCLTKLKEKICENEYFGAGDSDVEESVEGQIKPLRETKCGKIINEVEYEGEVHHHKGRTYFGTGDGKYYYEIKQDVREEKNSKAESPKIDSSQKYEGKDSNEEVKIEDSDEEYGSEEDANEEYESGYH